jgi:glycosyltransferase involved in cell wall biosynthesis
LEAWAAKLPVIITDVGGISQICTNENNALIVPSKNSKKLSFAMLRLIMDTDLRRKLGENGGKLVEEKYSWKKIVSNLTVVYKEFIQK